MSSEKQVVFVVDDCSASLKLTEYHLEKMGVDVITCDNGKDSIAIARQLRPELILLDIMMPETNGYQVCTELKRNEKTAAIPIIFLTSRDQNDDVIEGYRLGAVDYITKPIDPTDLRTRVGIVLRMLKNKSDLAKSIDSNLENHKIPLNNDESTSQQDTISAFVETMQTNCPDTARHCKNVKHLAVSIAQYLELDDETTEKIRTAALLHDIGKITIPQEILQKPDKLNDAEWAVMRHHPAVSEQILSPVRKLAEELDMIRHHHERFDGKGYPDGLAGEDISIGARILAIADTYDAITSNRCYRTAETDEEAVEEIVRCSGSQFDPKLVDAFVALKNDFEVRCPLSNRNTAKQVLTA